MASYWKSPYKEKAHSQNVHPSFAERSYPDPQLLPLGSRSYPDQLLPLNSRSYPDQLLPLNSRSYPDQLLPLGSRPYCGLSKVKQTTPVSPQDWFDWALTVSGGGFKPQPSAFRHGRGAAIKGILKLPLGETGTSDEGRSETGQDVECNNHSSRSESAVCKKEKKRVTFGDSGAADPPYSFRSYPNRPTPCLRTRLSRAYQTLEETSRPVRNLGHGPDLGKLPGVGGASVTVPERSPRGANGTCRHSPDLRCASCCIPPVETAKPSIPPLTLDYPHGKQQDDQQKTPVKSPANSGTLSTGSTESWPELPLPDPSFKQAEPITLGSSSGGRFEVATQEPLKRYKPHWSKTLARSVKRRRCSRLASVNKNPLAIGTFPIKPVGGVVDPQRAKTGNGVADDFSKLHIYGDGKVARMADPARDVARPGCGHKPTSAHKSPRRTQTTSRRAGNTREPAPTVAATNQSAFLPRGSSAPGRLREAGGDSLDGACMDKTSQILSWLNDVRSKSQFKPRDARTYASRPTRVR